MHQIAPF